MREYKTQIGASLPIQLAEHIDDVVAARNCSRSLVIERLVEMGFKYYAAVKEGKIVDPAVTKAIRNHSAAAKDERLYE